MSQSTTQDTKQTEFSAGTMIDHYRIIRNLGAGGMAQVYLAHDTMLGRKVAIKIIHPKRIGKQDAVERFLFEAKVTAQFNHPHIITIHSVGMTPQGPFLALEYLEGQTLRQRLEQERFSLGEALRTSKAIADALQAAHQKNLLHRDLKPENVMLVRDGRLRVLDFGLSRLLSAKQTDPGPKNDPKLRKTLIISDLEASNQKLIKGTPAYMAPEQWRAKDLGPEADIWALGITMYEMLAGYHPYQEATDVTTLCELVTNLDDVPQPVTKLRLPYQLKLLLERCVAKDPALRPTAAEVTLCLGQLLVGDSQQEMSALTPFRGLVPFEEEHGPLYFGREAEVDSFVERLRHEAVIPIVGRTGAGKSSFVKAGVIPRLREKSPLTLIHLRPGRNPFLTIANRLVQAWKLPIRSTGSFGPMGSMLGKLLPGSQEQEEDSLDNPQTLAVTLHERPQLLGFWLHRLAERHRVHVLLFVDQLEELWALPKENDVAQSSYNTDRELQGGLVARFMRAISTAADDPQIPVRVILTMREEFLSRLMTGSVVREALNRIMVLRKPSHRTLIEILVRSVKSVGYSFEDHFLPSDMVQEVQNSQAAFSLLQFAGQVLWQNRDQQRKVLTRDAFEKMGGVTGALVHHADGVLTGLTAFETQLARALLLRLVTENKTKRIMSHHDLLAGLEEGAQEVLQRLVDSRLVTVSRKTPTEGQAGTGPDPHRSDPAQDNQRQKEEGDCELIHEALIAGWDRLSHWIDESREELRLINQLRQASELWERRGWRQDDLWSAKAINEAQTILAFQEGNREELVERFIRSSERHNRMRRIKFLGLSSLILLAVVLAVWTVNNLFRDKLCTGANNLVAPAYNEQIKAAMKKTFVATKLSYANTTLRKVWKLLEHYSKSWMQEHKTTCEATHIRGEQSEEILDLRMNCLKHRLGELAALTEIFSAADQTIVEKAVQAASNLSDLDDCQNITLLRSKIPLPENTKIRNLVQQQRNKLLRIKALAQAGKYPTAMQQAEKATQAIEQIAYLPLEAEFLLTLGDLQQNLTHYVAAKETLEKAVLKADRAGHDSVRARALSQLVFILSYRLSKIDQAQSLIARAEAANYRMRDDQANLSDWHYSYGVFHFTTGNYQQAEASYKRCLRIREKQLGPNHPRVALMLHGLGVLYNTVGPYDQAEKLLQKALSIVQTSLGAEHPNVALVHNNLGVLYMRQKSWQKALAAYRRTLSIWEKTLGNQNAQLAIPIHNLGFIYAQQNNFQKALPLLQRAIAVSEVALGAEHPRIAWTLAILGEIYRAQGQLDQAQTTLEQSLRICSQSTCYSEPQGRAQFSLARVYHAKNQHPSKAYQLAQQAKKHLGSLAYLSEELAELEDWLQQSGLGKHH